MTEKREIDQKFAVICYGVAVCVSFALSAIVAAAVPKGNAYLYLSYLLPQVAYIGTYCAVSKVRCGRIPLLDRENVSGLDYLFALPVAAGLLFFALLPNAYITAWFGKIGLHASVSVPSLSAWYDYALGALILCVLPAIGEELVFRKAFCDGMRDVSTVKTVLLCGLAFGLSHLNPAQTVHQIFLGCVLALCYVLTKNVTVTMAMHAVNNALALFLPSITGEGFWNTITVLIASCVAGAAAIALGLFALIRRRRERLTERKTGKVEPVTWGMIAVLGAAWAIVTGLSFLG